MTRVPPGRAVTTAAVLSVVVLAQVGLVLAPSQLARHPLLVLALRPTPAFLLLVGDAVIPLVAVLVAAIGRTAVDAAYFAVARYGASPVVQRIGVGRDVTRGLSRDATTRSLLGTAFLWSSTPVIAAIGLGRTPLPTFVLVTGAGNLVTSAAFVLLGHRFSAILAPVSAWLTAHGTTLGAALAAMVALSGGVAWRRARSA